MSSTTKRRATIGIQRAGFLVLESLTVTDEATKRLNQRMTTVDRQIGRSVRRFEDARFLRGRGRFVDDIDVPGQLHAVVLRSPHGHAEIARIDAAAAQAPSGV